MNALEQAAFDLVYDQLAEHSITANDYYTVDLVTDIISDHRIARTKLNLGAYIKAVGPEGWRTLIRTHAHTIRRPVEVTPRLEALSDY